MLRLRRRDDDGLNHRVIDELLPVCSRPRKAVGGPIALRRVAARGGDHLQARPKLGVEHGAHGRIGNRVGLAHIAAANDADSDLGHAFLPSAKKTFCKRLQNW